MFGPSKKPWLWTEKIKQNALALLYLASGLLPNAANSSNVPTEFAAEHNKAEVLEGKFRNLNFLPFTKKTTEYIGLNFSFPVIERGYFSQV